MRRMFQVSCAAAAAMLLYVIVFTYDAIPAAVEAIWTLALIGAAVSGAVLAWRWWSGRKAPLR